jgi:ATP-dependent RNA helicase RhlE
MYMEITKFEKLNLIPPILRALKEKGYETPTPIQAQSIQAILQKKDIIGCAQTGTGKTAAFSIPMLQLLHEEQKFEKGLKRIKALIVTPTRELAIQIGESLEAYGRYLNLRHAVIFGGVNQISQTKKLQRGVDILVATPGRLLDLMTQKYIDLGYVKIFTLDEADRMLDMGFINDVKKIIAKLPQKKQSLFFSATMPPAIIDLTNRLLVDPIKVSVAPVSSTADTVEQKIYHVDRTNKQALLIHVLKEKSIESALVFTRTKHGANKVTTMINKAGINAEAIHGNKSQSARQKALQNFKSKQTRILVATDIAARGIDINELSHVINYEIPNVPETYVHRIGRTGRAGASGIALTFCDHEEQKLLKDLEKLIKRSIPVVNDHPFVLSGAPQVPVGQVAKTNNGNSGGFRSGRNNRGANRRSRGRSGRRG